MEVSPNSTPPPCSYDPQNEVPHREAASFGHLWTRASELSKKILELALQILEMVQQKFFSAEMTTPSHMGKSESRQKLTEMMNRGLGVLSGGHSFRDDFELERESAPGDPLAFMGSSFNIQDQRELEKVNPQEAASFLCSIEFSYLEMTEKNFLELLHNINNLILKLSLFPDLKKQLEERKDEVNKELNWYMSDQILWEVNGEIGIQLTPFCSGHLKEMGDIETVLSDLSCQRQVPVLLFSHHEEKGVECQEQSGLEYHHSTAEAVLLYSDGNRSSLSTILRNSPVSPGNSNPR